MARYIILSVGVSQRMCWHGLKVPETRHPEITKIQKPTLLLVNTFAFHIQHIRRWQVAPDAAYFPNVEIFFQKMLPEQGILKCGKYALFAHCFPGSG